MQTKRRRWERGEARPANAPCRPRTPAREGGGGGLGLPSTSTVPLLHPQPPAAPGPGGVLRGSARAAEPLPQLLPGQGEQAAKGEGEGRGMRGPGFPPSTLAHPEQPAGDDGSAEQGSRAPDRGLAFRASPPPQRGMGGRGAAVGKSDPTTSASVQARPKLSVGGGGSGAVREPGEDPGRAPDSTRVPYSP
jgi:hypothetical protein